MTMANNIYWSEGEIVNSYRLAKDPYHQISVLAQLNACKKDDILKILQKNGYALDYKAPASPDRKWRNPREKKYYELYLQGYTSTEIAKATYSSYWRVQKWVDWSGSTSHTKRWAMNSKGWNSVVDLIRKNYSDDKISDMLQCPLKYCKAIREQLAGPSKRYIEE